ncbi:bifunctional aldolase/short-chain dehydrogenase [Alphaproteobacteria bacterium]|nr:bifunctional aldolase/short-chain dehydrogenase [Alphaproteobacteria bacterium]
MKSLWNNKIALQYVSEYKKKNISKDLALRIYTTHLLGKNPKLVLHGGGNSSVKSIGKNLYKKNVNLIYVKGSGWDMSNLNELGMPGLELNPLLETVKLNKLNDNDMVNLLRSNLINANSPNPSVETLLHAYLPFKFVDHTHSNAFLSILNQPNSQALIKKIFGNKVGIVPYIMPGFSLAKECLKIFKKDEKVQGLALINHGIFTFGDSAKQSYERMINFVSDVENYISKNKVKLKTHTNKSKINMSDFMLSVRKSFSTYSNHKWILKFHNNNDDRVIASTQNLNNLINKGPVTPDHVIRIKSKILFISKNKFQKIDEEIKKYCQSYKKYYLKNKTFVHNCTITDPLPRIIILEGIGILSLGKKLKDQKISYDIFRSMASSVFDAERIGKFKSIIEKDIFKMEYWPLERAKLDNAKVQSLDGNNVIITGGGGTIGMAIAKKFKQEGANIILIDKKYDKHLLEKNNLHDCFLINADLTNNQKLKKIVEKIVLNFGGIDILISNAGRAFQGAIETVDPKIIKKSYDINFLSHQNISQLTVQVMKKQNTGGLILYNLSKQAINPGKNFGPYGLAKSTTLFLMKQYALECGEYNIRVNGINADRIESGLLTKELINQRATSRGISKEKYLSNNLLNIQVLADDVAEAFYAQTLLKKTTANIITVDGGNIEASLR